MDTVSADGKFVAVFIPALGGSPVLVLEDCAHYEIYCVETGALVGILPGTSKFLCIQWPFVVAVQGARFEVWTQGDAQIYMKDHAIGEVSGVDSATFVARNKIVIGWARGEDRTWGLFQIPEVSAQKCDTCELLRTAKIEKGMMVHACSDSHIEFRPVHQAKVHSDGVLDGALFTDLATLRTTKSIDRNNRLALKAASPIMWSLVPFRPFHYQTHGLATVADNCTIQLSCQTYTQSDLRRFSRADLRIDPVVGSPVRVRAPGIAITPDKHWFVIRKTQATGSSGSFEARRTPCFQGCGGDDAAHARMLKENYKYAWQHARLNAILSAVLPVAIIDDIFRCF